MNGLKTEEPCRTEQKRTEPPPPPTPTYIWLFCCFSSSLNISLFLSCFVYWLCTVCTHVAFTFVWLFFVFFFVFGVLSFSRCRPFELVVVLSALLLTERMKNEDAMRTSRYGKSKCNVYTHRTLEREKNVGI